MYFKTYMEFVLQHAVGEEQLVAAAAELVARAKDHTLSKADRDAVLAIAKGETEGG